MNQQFAIKYRPQNLNSVIGQDITVKILKNAISKEKLGHAIIFTGIRGTGKTSLARIIAKTINCENLEKDSLSPCEKCHSCKTILNNQSVDVIEIDAASNTSVDDMREIIDSCKYKPVTSKYKVYIIDEVHMLSKSAFNAILKTLEEPPQHVKFIFATTDIQKVPETILSRCLRFDLRKITESDVTSCLRSIVDKEGIDIDTESLAVIAKKSSGSMRDALSTLSLVVNLDSPIKSDAVKTFLSIVDNTFMIDFLKHTIDADLNTAIQMLREYSSKIFSFKDFWLGIMEVLHRLMCIKLSVSPISDTKFSTDELNSLNIIAAKTSVFDLNNMWQIIVKGIDELSFSPEQLIASEIILFRLCYSAKLPDISGLMAAYPEAEVKTCPLPTNIIQNEEIKSDHSVSSDIQPSSTEDIMKIIEKDAILYGYFKSSCEIQSIKEKKIQIGESETLPDSVKRKVEKLLKPLEIEWKEKEIFNEELISNMKGLFTIQKEEEI